MMNLIEYGVMNSILVVPLAIVAYIATRVLRSPHVAHMVWLIVLIKLFSPPLLAIPSVWHSTAVTTAHVEDSEQIHQSDGQAIPITVASRDLEQANEPSQSMTPVRHHRASSEPIGFVQFVLTTDWIPLLSRVWIIGSVLCGFLSIWRIIRFRQSVKQCGAIPSHIKAITDNVSRRLGLRAVPDVRVCDATYSPMVWPEPWRPTVLIPRTMLDHLSRNELEALFSHEFAHIARKDHWVRWFELATSIGYWWHPIAWYARQRLRIAEEQCCDLLAVNTSFANAPKTYAETLFRIADLARTDRTTFFITSMAAGNKSELRGRIQAILSDTLPKRPPRFAIGLILTIALVVLPLYLTGEHARNDPRLITLEKSHAQLRSYVTNVQGVIRMYRTETVNTQALSQPPSELGIPLTLTGTLWRSQDRFRANYTSRSVQFSSAIDGNTVYELAGDKTENMGNLRIMDRNSSEGSAALQSIEYSFLANLDALWSDHGRSYIELLRSRSLKIAFDQSKPQHEGYSLRLSKSRVSEGTLEFEATQGNPFRYSCYRESSGKDQYQVERRVFTRKAHGVVYPTRIVHIASWPGGGYTEVVLLDLEPLQDKSPIEKEITAATFRDMELGYQIYRIGSSGRHEILGRFDRPVKLGEARAN